MDEFKTGIILETAERLRDNGHEEEASDLEWDIVVHFIAGCFEEVRT